MGFYSIYDRIIGNPTGDLLSKNNVELPSMKGNMKRKYDWHTRIILLFKSGTFSKIGKYDGFGRVQVGDKEINVHKSFSHFYENEFRPIALLQATVKAIKKHKNYNTLIKPNLKQFYHFLLNFEGYHRLNNFQNQFTDLNQVHNNTLFAFENPTDSRQNEKRIARLVDECINIFLKQNPSIQNKTTMSSVKLTKRKKSSPLQITKRKKSPPLQITKRTKSSPLQITKRKKSPPRQITKRTTYF